MNDERGAALDGYDRTLVDRDGKKIGKVADIYLDRNTGKPEWALVHAGIFGDRHTVVPIWGAMRSGDDLIVPYEKDFVKDVPNVATEEGLSDVDEARLAQYYGLRSSKARPRSGLPTGSSGRRRETDGGRDEA